MPNEIDQPVECPCCQQVITGAFSSHWCQHAHLSPKVLAALRNQRTPNTTEIPTSELEALRERVAKLEAALVKADEMAKAADTATVWRDKESLDALDLALAVFAEANPVLDNDAREATK